MTPQFAGWITACVAHYRCHRYVRRAVESLLQQSYPWIRIVVINDGDPVPPWRELAHIRDPRLFKLDLKRNWGPYFCLEVARRATSDPFFLVQDADDWSAPVRAEMLLANLLADSTDFSVSALAQFAESPDLLPYHIGLLWDQVVPGAAAATLRGSNETARKFVHVVPHHGLFRSSILQEIGGYYGGFRIRWDRVITNLVLMIGTVSWTPVPSYYWCRRSDSLTHSTSTGICSQYASAVAALVHPLYKECRREYLRFLKQDIDRLDLLQRIKRITARYVSGEDRRALDLHVQRLRKVML